MTIWFTSDTHFDHFNCIEFCDRPIGINPRLHSRDEQKEAMNETLIKNWNECVAWDDQVYHLGDFAFCGVSKATHILDQLNGDKYLIRGNHDKDLCKKEEFTRRFIWVKDYYVLRVHDKTTNTHQPIVLCHFPILSWENQHHGNWHLHGHCHGSISAHNSGIRRLDVGVDSVGAIPALGRSFSPVSFDDVQRHMQQQGIRAVEGDYHR